MRLIFFMMILQNKGLLPGNTPENMKSRGHNVKYHTFYG